MDPLGNAFNTLLSPDIAGSTVLVLGCGPIGCFAVGVARAAGAAKVIASDVNPVRLDLARGMGAQVLLNAASDDVVARVRSETCGDGADLVCEMSGHPSAIKQAFQSARLGGRIHLLGLPKGDVPLDLADDLIFKGVTVYGVVGRKMFETWNQMRSFLSSGMLDPTPVVTHQFPLAEIDRALEAIRSGAAGKVILEIGS
jgi:threonine 3-dehydrogenase